MTAVLGRYPAPTNECGGSQGWLSATVDGARVVYRVMQPGEQQTIAVHDEAVLRIGNPAAFTFLINGKAGRSLGPGNEPVTLDTSRRRTIGNSWVPECNGRQRPPANQRTVRSGLRSFRFHVALLAETSAGRAPPWASAKPGFRGRTLHGRRVGRKPARLRGRRSFHSFGFCARRIMVLTSVGMRRCQLKRGNLGGEVHRHLRPLQLNVAETIYEGASSLNTFPNRGRIGKRPGSRELVFEPYILVDRGRDWKGPPVLRLLCWDVKNLQLK